MMLLDEAAGLIERMPSLAHVVADEAQDLSPLAKGLEFDNVVLVEPGRIAGDAEEAHGLRRLYVGLTRSVSRLTVLHAQPLSEALCYVP